MIAGVRQIRLAARPEDLVIADRRVADWFPLGRLKTAEAGVGAGKCAVEEQL